MLGSSPGRALSRYSQWRVFTCRSGQIRWASSNANGNGVGKDRSGRVKGSPRKADSKAIARDGEAEESSVEGAAGKKPSLIEQLFPEETKRDEEARRAAERDIPRLPLDELPRPLIRKRFRDEPEALVGASAAARRQWLEMRRQDLENQEVTVLVMRNASLNLTDDDFRRLVPQGKHMEGWTLDQADIIKVIPGRKMATLEQENYYYLLFSSRLAAFTYQGHVLRMFRTVASQTPSSVTSPIPPPPGYMIDGMDAHAAIETFSLIPPSQRCELRQLKDPLAPAVASIVRHQGYAALVNRPSKSPFECRLTFDGPQLRAPAIRYIILKTGQSIGVTWSGGDALVPKITKWEPPAYLTGFQPSPTDPGSRRALDWLRKEEEAAQHDAETAAKMRRRIEKKRQARVDGFGVPRADARVVYVLGFETAGAAHRFMAFWHRREMVAKDESGRGRVREEHDDEDAPAVANVEMLW